MARGAKSQAGGTARGGETGKPRRQAIVVVHGQGEQRPMGTIRGFVETLWTRNEGVSRRGGEDLPPEEQKSFWVVPDRKTGLYELARITTPTAADGWRSDFFELYYADLLSETPFRNLYRWLRRLVQIDPVDVPAAVRWPWSLFCILAFVAVVSAGFVILSLPAVVHTEWLRDLFKPENTLPALIIALMVALQLFAKLFSLFAFMHRLPKWLPNIIILGALIAMFRDDLVAIALITEALVIYLAVRFLLPYFGDAASYLSAHTETVTSRQAVRARGLNLLRALHADPQYERIVIVAHSLGTVLAYDLLHILWGEVGPTKDNPPNQTALDALQAVDDFVARQPEDCWPAQTVLDYRAVQWQAFRALADQPPGPGKGGVGTRHGWKVSDLVTLGSPLASAQFLMTESVAEFDLMKTERMFPTAPARPYAQGQQALYVDAASGDRVSHHGAVFSVVRWANIYHPFHPIVFLSGDPISGPVSGRSGFGPGIADIPVTIPGGHGTPDIFKHNYYWTEVDDRDAGTDPHIRKLRAAIGLSEDERLKGIDPGWLAGGAAK